MAAWSTWLPDVAVHVPAAPSPVINQALCRAARHFCARTRAWRVWLACGAGDPGEYSITLPAETQAVRIERVTVDGRPLDVIPFTWFQRDWSAFAEEEEAGAVTDDLANLIVTGPSLDGDVQAQLSLMPTIAATGISDFLSSRYFEAIAAGALARIFAMKGAPWLDLDAVGMWSGEFERAIVRAQDDVSRAHTGRYRRPKLIWF